MLDASLAVILVQMHQDFGIAFCLKPVPLRDESITQFLEIVDLSVHHHADRSALVPDRLASPNHINDAQTAHSQADRIFDIPPLIVRPTMDQGSDHPGQALVVPKSSKPADSAHYRQASLTRTTQSSRHRHRVVSRKALHAMTSMVGPQAIRSRPKILKRRYAIQSASFKIFRKMGLPRSVRPYSSS